MSFERIIEGGYVYVDKTELIYRLTHESSICFLSRPRRFGKSLLVSTLENYYRGRKELFRGLAMERLEKDWYVYPVFHVDFNGSDFTRIFPNGSVSMVFRAVRRNLAWAIALQKCSVPPTKRAAAVP